MRRNVLLGAVVVVLLALVTWRLWPRGPASSVPQAGSASKPVAGSTAPKKAREPAVPASISGRVTRESDGAGVPGAIVALTPKRSLTQMFSGGDERVEDKVVTTSADGTWSASDVAPDTYAVSATARGLVPSSRRVTVASGKNQTGIDLVLGAGGIPLRGTVSDVLGGPVPAAKVTAKSAKTGSFSDMAGTVFTTFTDEKGTYELALPAETYALGVKHEEYTDGSDRVELFDVPVTVDFTLTPGASIKGQVVTHDGTPVPGALVGASASSWGIQFGDDSSVSDAEGNFTLKGLEPGALSVSATGAGYSTVSPTVVEVGIGEQIEGVRVVVDKGFTVSGRIVTKGTQTGVAGVRVGVFSIASKQSGFARDTSSEDGAFEIQGLRPASYMLVAIGDDVMPEVGKAVEVVDKDVTDVVIEVANGVTVTGRVEPPAVADLSITPTTVGFGNMFEAVKAGMVRAQSDATGAFKLEHVPAGSFKLEARATDGRAGEAALLVAAVDKSDAVVKLEPRASISGRVTDAAGKAVGDVSVRARPTTKKEGQVSFSMNGGGGDSAHTRADGSFKIVGLDAGTFELSVSDDNGPIAWASPADKAKPTKAIEVEVVAATAKTDVALTIELRDGKISGVVLGPDGKAAADVWVTPSPEADKDDVEGETSRGRWRWGANYSPVLTSADGRFSIDRLRRGTYRLAATAANGTAHGEKTGVKVGESVTLALSRLGVLSGKATQAGAPVTTYDLECVSTAKTVERRITDPAGAYSFERLPPGDYACTASSDAGHTTMKILVPAGEAKLDLVLTPWASLTGKVVSVLNGEPVPNVKAFAKTKGGGEPNGQDMMDLISGGGPTSNASGVFVIPHVTPGTGDVTLLAATGGFEPLATKVFTVADGQRADLGAIKVIPPRTGDAGTFGMSVSAGEAWVTVDDVRAGGPAEAAGVHLGDKITSLNGIDIATLTPVIATRVLSSGTLGVGVRVALGLERAGSALQATVTSVKW